MKNCALQVVRFSFALTIASSVYAFPIKLTNVRPTAVQTPAVLQGELNQIYGAGVVPVNSELNMSLFALPSTVSLKLTLQFEDSNQAVANADRFGIFSLAQTVVGGHPVFDIHGNPVLDSSSIKTQEIFKGAAGPGAIATVNKTAGGIVIGGSNPLLPTSCVGTAVDCGQTAPISFSYFGFYLYRPLHATNPKNDTGTNGYANPGGNPGGNFWTVDQLNIAAPKATSAGKSLALIYQGHDPNQWTVAFNDVNNVQKKYDGFVVSINAANSFPAPVPEPAALLLFGTAVLGLVTRLRRKAGLKEGLEQANSAGPASELWTSR